MSRKWELPICLPYPLCAIYKGTQVFTCMTGQVLSPFSFAHEADRPLPISKNNLVLLKKIILFVFCKQTHLLISEKSSFQLLCNYLLTTPEHSTPVIGGNLKQNKISGTVDRKLLFNKTTKLKVQTQR